MTRTVKDFVLWQGQGQACEEWPAVASWNSLAKTLENGLLLHFKLTYPIISNSRSIACSSCS